ncbi:MAG: ATP-dependent helicase, partial [Mycobacteriaceae bacterium]
MGAGAQARLVYREPEPLAERSWPQSVSEVLNRKRVPVGWEPIQVLGGPGTGKTSLLIDTVVSHITSGVDPESVLVLTPSKRAASDIRTEITSRLLGTRTRATREPLVRTLHSYAFAVLRLQAAQSGNPPPRLMTSSEQDAVLRELLRGNIEDAIGGRSIWPKHLQSALPMAGFASALRDLILRCAERGLGPEDIISLGRKYSRPEWVAAGKVAVQYEQVMLLRGAVGMEAPQATAPALNAAELVSAAVTAFMGDPEVLQAQRSRVRYLLVDDAQHLDPQAAQLIRLLGTGAELTVIAGDPDQAVFGFRGADSSFLLDLADVESPQRIVLDVTQRNAQQITDLAARISARIPGSAPGRGPRASEKAGDGLAEVRILSSASKEAAVIADVFRRSHLAEGVPWSQMAVIARSVPHMIIALRRAFHAAGVPLLTVATELPLARQQVVSGLLLVLRALSAEFSNEDAIALICSPIGGADPAKLRRLRRGIRRVERTSGGDRDSALILRLLLTSDLEDEAHRVLGGLTEVEAEPLQRVLNVMDKVRTPVNGGRGIEEVLWAAWQTTGLQRRLMAASARGGSIGAQADRDLDAVIALFDAAANYVDRLPAAPLSGFVEYVEEQEIPAESRLKNQISVDAVTVLSAHSAVGREWEVVAVCGVQEGLWPGLRSRGSLLGTEDLVDIIDGTAVSSGNETLQLSRTAPLLAQERSLFLVACTRAKTRLLVTAVSSLVSDNEQVPSRFLEELVGEVQLEVGHEPLQAERVTTRVLALPALVAELRSVVCSDQEDEDKKLRATYQLARLAHAGVPGAHPDSWYGVAEVSTTKSLWQPQDGAVVVSPSTVDQLHQCALRWFLERHGGKNSDSTHALTGTVIHTLVQAAAGNITEAQAQTALEQIWPALDFGARWFAIKELVRAETMLVNFTQWLANSRNELTEIGVEVPIDIVLTSEHESMPQVRIRGRIDRLEKDIQGRPVVVDIKTARTPVSKEAAENHAQLATYQVALTLGGVAGVPAGESGGGRLVFVAKSHNKEGSAQ